MLPPTLARLVRQCSPLPLSPSVPLSLSLCVLSPYPSMHLAAAAGGLVGGRVHRAMKRERNSKGKPHRLPTPQGHRPGALPFTPDSPPDSPRGFPPCAPPSPQLTPAPAGAGADARRKALSPVHGLAADWGTGDLPPPPLPALPPPQISSHLACTSHLISSLSVLLLHPR